jgi:dUTPase
MNVKYYLKNVEGLIVPNRANETDAGYDVTATSEPAIVGTKSDFGTFDDQRIGEYYSITYVEFETNLYVTPTPQAIEYSPYAGYSDLINFHTDLRPRSSISKYNLVLANSIGLIDRGYKNQILVRFKYIWQPCDLRASRFGDIKGLPDMSKIYKKGDKICQLLPIVTNGITFEVVDNLPGEDRGGGFGSTGK